ncbi:hypothetical protein, partial [Pseudomonas syringae group genomosp. 7]|uniref:hypothetical protein n=1 Tax=Pseudomonas syringae group genomosp. 7 TaxID=251699 RepID=UPI00376FE79D
FFLLVGCVCCVFVFGCCVLCGFVCCVCVVVGWVVFGLWWGVVAGLGLGVVGVGVVDVVGLGLGFVVVVWFVVSWSWGAVGVGFFVGDTCCGCVFVFVGSFLWACLCCWGFCVLFFFFLVGCVSCVYV